MPPLPFFFSLSVSVFVSSADRLEALVSQHADLCGKLRVLASRAGQLGSASSEAGVARCQGPEESVDQLSQHALRAGAGCESYVSGAASGPRIDTQAASPHTVAANLAQRYEQTPQAAQQASPSGIGSNNNFLLLLLLLWRRRANAGGCGRHRYALCDIRYALCEASLL